jgi:hypothetical protein
MGHLPASKIFIDKNRHMDRTICLFFVGMVLLQIVNKTLNLTIDILKRGRHEAGYK